ncbi:MAG: C40 family peptidase [Chloroflexota bacterium]
MPDRYQSLKIILMALAIATLAGCQSAVRFAEDAPHGGRGGSTSPVAHGKPSKPVDVKKKSPKPLITTAERKKIIREAEKWLGAPYVWGGNTKDGVDCSGFTKQVYSAAAGITLPRTAHQQFLHTRRVDLDDCKPGDLIFFSKGGAITHVGIYAGDGDLIHASSSRGVVRESLDQYYYRERYAGAGSILGS